MKIGIIGGGFTGLSAAYKLQKLGHSITLFEKEKNPGGLAIGFKEKNWDWALEEHYHHLFTNDKIALKLAKEIGTHVIINRPKTSTLINNSIYQLDSPLSLIKFPLLSQIERIRMGLALAMLKYNPFWQVFDKKSIHQTLPKMMGKRAYEMIWEPLLVGKFGNYVNGISMAWFWARIKKRTSSLAYPEGGYLEFAKKMTKKIEKLNGKILFNTEILEIKTKKNKPYLCYHDLNHDSKKGSLVCFDKIIVTIPSPLFIKITPQLPLDYKEKIKDLKFLAATNLLLRLKKPFLLDGIYWLNICDTQSKLMAVVEHTNFMDKKYYDNEHLVYVGHYIPQEHKYFNMGKEDFFKMLDPYLQKINKGYKENLIDAHFFKAPYAQPIITPGYAKKIPPLKTPIKNIYLANMSQIYPWDRGVNYAIELGEKIAKIISKS
ncbi:MAG: FAD-dependent oxidoreductase [Patescibacteria group bacterium]|nr:FAD-dependent oxidoreductase [Patescibacteria group bacterium]